MVLRISYHCSTSITGQPAGVLGADSGYTDPVPMSLMLTQLLNVPLSP